MKSSPHLIFAVFFVTSLACNTGTFNEFFLGFEGDEELISVRETATSTARDVASTATEEALDILKAEATQTAISVGENEIGTACPRLTYEECTVAGLHQYEVEYASFHELCSTPSDPLATYEWGFSEGVATLRSGEKVVGAFVRVSENVYARASDEVIACHEIKVYENGFQCVFYDLEGNLCTLTTYTRIDP